MTKLVIYDYMYKARSQQSGFSMVELIVVIIVIGILTTIAIISYTGISKQATVVSLQSDLTNAVKQQKLFQLDNGRYATTISTDCAAQPTTTTNICLKASDGNTYTDYQVDNPSNPQSFTLTEAKNNLYYSVTDNGSPAFLASSRYWKSIAGGYNHTCAISSDNQAYCWGDNSNGQLGNNSIPGSSSVPVAVDTTGVLSGKTIKSITAGLFHTCAIASDNQAYCWGSNSAGQLGNNSQDYSSKVPVPVYSSGWFSDKTVKAITAGNNYTCAIYSDNQAYCWGDDIGALGIGTISVTHVHVPEAVDTTGVLSGKTIKSIMAGYYHTCVTASDNQAYCWGFDDSGQLGNNSTTKSLVPVAVTTTGVLSGKTIKSIAVGYNYTCAIASDSQAYCWGSNSDGQLGNNSTANSLVPVAFTTTGVLSGKTIKSIMAGSFYTCTLASDDKAYCLGRNSSGELGNNSTTNSLVPVAVDTTGVLSGKTIKSITAGDYHACAIASDNQAYCWGSNGGVYQGKLGNNSYASSLVPVAVVPLGG